MSFADLINANVTITSRVEVSREDGTPKFGTVTKVYRGWFDEADAEELNSVDRDGVPLFMRRATLMLRADQTVQSDDDISVVLDGAGGPGTGPDLGKWQVDVPRAVPQPGGIAHWEITVSKIKESG